MFHQGIEEALLEKPRDLAVHSLKDLPTELAADFEIAAITTRENPRDVFLRPSTFPASKPCRSARTSAPAACAAKPS